MFTIILMRKSGGYEENNLDSDFLIVLILRRPKPSTILLLIDLLDFLI